MGINSTHRNAKEKPLISPLMALRGGELEHNNGVLTIMCLLGRKRAFPLLRDINALMSLIPLGILKRLQIQQWLRGEE